jgi:ABC-type sugar transport system ATPase subunit
MVGRELHLDLTQRRPARELGELVLSAKGIKAPKVNGIDLEVSKGQIVGLGGLVGAGRTELLRAIIGADPRSAGRVTITSNGKKRVITGYLSAIKAGVAYVPEERRTDGLALTMTVAENIFLPNRKEISPTGVMPKGKIAAFAKDLSEKVNLRPPEVTREAGQYSGGNQQKIVIAKWLGRKPSFIVLDEPTRGVDVGAKAEIHKLVKELADNGAAVLVISSDLPELLELSDLIHVVRDGKIAAFAKDLSEKVNLRPPEVTREAGQYSGGNQQKIVIAKWLGRKPSFIVLDEPTRGVDVGAKAEIHKLVKELADNGAAVLVISSDLPELLELSDLIHVVRDGKIAGTLTGAEATEKSVMSLAAGEKLVGA